MTYQEKLAFLRRYREAVQQEDTILQEIEALRTQAARVTQALTGMPGSGDGQALPRAVEQILEAQEKFALPADLGGEKQVYATKADWDAAFIERLRRQAGKK